MDKIKANKTVKRQGAGRPKIIVDIEIYYTGSQNVNSNFLHVAVIQNDIIEDPMIQAGGSGKRTVSELKG